MCRTSAFLCFVALLLVWPLSAFAGQAILFSDDFTEGARPEWGNEHGNWIATGGSYHATVLDNGTTGVTHSSITSLPGLTDFFVELDVLNSQQGGIFLRSNQCAESPYVLGVLFAMAGNYVYWHISDCAGWGEQYNKVEVPGLQASNPHVKIVVDGANYSAYLNRNLAPITTLVTDQYSSGMVALYDFSAQEFDNVQVGLDLELTISPPSGTYVSTQSFDLALIVATPERRVVGGSATFNDIDITSILLSCVTPGTLLDGGQTFRCPGIGLGPGIYTMEVTLDFNDASSVTDSVTWTVKSNAEP